MTIEELTKLRELMAILGVICLILSGTFGYFYNKSNNKLNALKRDEQTKELKDKIDFSKGKDSTPKIDLINSDKNHIAGRDINIKTTYNIQPKEKEEKSMNKDKPKNQIINNAPVNAPQVVGDNGTINIINDKEPSLSEYDKLVILSAINDPKYNHLDISVESIQGNFFSEKMKSIVIDFIENNGKEVKFSVISSFNQMPEKGVISLNFDGQLRFVCGCRYLFDTSK